jgi:hypothetical protein
MSDQPVSETSTYIGQHNIETQETNINALSGIRTCDPSNQAAADLRLRPRGYQGQHDSVVRREELWNILSEFGTPMKVIL